MINKTLQIYYIINPLYVPLSLHPHYTTTPFFITSPITMSNNFPIALITPLIPHPHPHTIFSLTTTAHHPRHLHTTFPLHPTHHYIIPPTRSHRKLLEEDQFMSLNRARAFTAMVWKAGPEYSGKHATTIPNTALKRRRGEDLKILMARHAFRSTLGLSKSRQVAAIAAVKQELKPVPLTPLQCTPTMQEQQQQEQQQRANLMQQQQQQVPPTLMQQQQAPSTTTPLLQDNPTLHEVSSTILQDAAAIFQAAPPIHIATPPIQIATPSIHQDVHPPASILEPPYIIASPSAVTSNDLRCILLGDSKARLQQLYGTASLEQFIDVVVDMIVA